MPNRRNTWPYNRWDPNLNRNPPVAEYLAPGVWERSDRDLAGPLRMGTEPRVGPKGRAVIADYDTRGSDHGMDMIARDRKLDRKFPSDLIARQIRGNGPVEKKDTMSEGKRFPK